MGRRYPDANRRGKEGLKSSRDKNASQGKNRSGEEGEETHFCFVTPDLSDDYSSRKETEEKGEYNKWDEDKIK